MMKKTNFLNIAAALSIGISFLPGCNGETTRKHNHAAQEIIQERAQTDKAAADLSPAVSVIDRIAWDSAKDYRLFKDAATRRIAACNRKIAVFKASAKTRHNKLPLQHRKRIRRLEQRSKELQQRLDGYVLQDQAHWDDFCRLFNYDLQQFEAAAGKLQ